MAVNMRHDHASKTGIQNTQVLNERVLLSGWARAGTAALPQVAKMHFRTALRAQGLPEPPKVKWRSRSA